MDNVDFLKEILLALKFELIRFRFAAVTLGLVVLFLVLGVGLTWQNQYVSRAILEVDDSNIIKPLLRGRAEFADIDRVDEAKNLMDSKALLEQIARRLGYIDDDSSSLEVNEYIKTLRGHISVEPDVERKNFFSIAYAGSDPELAYESANVLVEEFVRFQQQSRRAEGEIAFEFITKQADAYKERLEKAERALQEFKAQSLDTNEETVQRRINELESEIQELKLSIQESESRILSMRAQLGNESKYLDVQAKIYDLKQQRFVLQERLNELRLQYQDSYPDIVTIKQQISNLDAEIVRASGGSDVVTPMIRGRNALETNPEVLFEELRKQLAVQEVSLKAQRERLVSLERLLEEEREKADIVVENQTTSADLMRDYTVTKNAYEELLARKENAGLSVAIQKDGRGLTFRVVEEPAYPFYPTGLTFAQFLIAAPILAIGLPIGLIIALVILDPRIRTMTALKMSLDDDNELLGVSGHYHTAFSERVLKKDMLILSGIVALVAAIYIYIAIVGLQA